MFWPVCYLDHFSSGRRGRHVRKKSLFVLICSRVELVLHLHVTGFNVFITGSVEGANWSIIFETELLSNDRPLSGFLLHFGV